MTKGLELWQHPDLLAFQRRMEGRSDRPVVFFVGAGLSAICGLPLWHDTLRLLTDHGEATGRISPTTKDILDRLIKAASYLECGSILRRELGPRLEEKLTTLFGAPPPENLGAYEDLVRLPCAGFVTTNYDSLIEAAYTRHNGKPLRVITRQHRAGLAGLRAGEAFILKLHGDVARNEFVISSEDYAAIRGDESFMRVLYSIFFKYAFLFLGYGMSDDDILMPLKLMAQDLGPSAPRHVAFLPSTLSTSTRRELEDKAAVNVVLYGDGSSHESVEELPLRWLAETGDAGLRNAFFERPSDCARALQKTPDLISHHLRQVATRACDWLMGIDSIGGLEPGSAPRAANLAEELIAFHTSRRVLGRSPQEEKAVDLLLSFQDATGGFLSQSVGVPTTHTTALSAYALSLYEDLGSRVVQANERAAEWLQRSCKSDTGGWATFGAQGVTRIVPSIWAHLALAKLDSFSATHWKSFCRRLQEHQSLGYILGDNAKSNAACGWMLWLLSFLRRGVSWTESEAAVQQWCVGQLTASQSRLIGEHEGFVIDEGGPETKQGIWIRWIHATAAATAIGTNQWVNDGSGPLSILGSAVAQLLQQARVGEDGHFRDGTIEQDGATPFVFPTLYGLWAVCEVIQSIAGTLINKIGLFVVRDGKVLLLRKRGTHQLIAPGGSINPGEALLEALQREIREELGAEVVGESFLAVFEDAAAFERGATIRITGYLGQLTSEPQASAEIAECVWVDSTYPADSLSPIIRRKVMPELRARGLIA